MKPLTAENNCRDFTDEELVRMALTGSYLTKERAWECLLGKYRRLIWKRIIDFHIKDEDKEDAFMEVVLKLVKELKLYDAGRGSFPAFLNTLTINVLITIIKRLYGETQISEKLIIVEPELEFILRDYLISELTSTEFDMCWLRYEGYSYEEIAKTINCTKNQVKNSLYKIRGKLQSLNI